MSNFSVGLETPRPRFNPEVGIARSNAEKFLQDNSLLKRLSIRTIPDRIIFTDRLTGLAVDQELVATERDIDRLKSARFFNRRVLGIIPRIRHTDARNRRATLLDARDHLRKQADEDISNLPDVERERAAIIISAAENLFEIANQNGFPIRISSGARVEPEILDRWEKEWSDRLK